MLKSIWFFLLFSSVLQAAEQKEVHPYYQQLKFRRTYYTIQNVGNFNHNFVVWFHDKEVSHCTVQASSVEEVRTFDLKKNGKCMVGGFSVKPEKYPEVPAELAEYSDEIVKLIKSRHPEAKDDIAVGYYGQKRFITIGEYIPLDTDSKKMFGSAIVMDFATDKDLTKLERATGSGRLLGFGGYRLFCDKYDDVNCAEKPVFIDYIVPEALQGSSVFSSQFSPGVKYMKIDTRYAAEWKTLSQKILAAAKDFKDAKSKDVFNDINKALGDGVAPKNFRNLLTFDVEFSGSDANKDDFNDRVNSGVIVNDPEGIYEVVTFYEGFKLKVVTTVNLKKGFIETAVNDTDGQQQKLRFERSEKLVGRKIAIDDRVYPTFIAFDAPRPNGFTENSIYVKLSNEVGKGVKRVTVRAPTFLNVGFIFPQQDK